MEMWKLAIISFCIINIFVNGKEKRILANDPSFTEQRLAHLESLVQQQQSEISQLKSQMQSGSSQSMYFFFTVYLLLYVTDDNISITYVTLNRWAGGLKQV